LGQWKIQTEESQADRRCFFLPPIVSGTFLFFSRRDGTATKAHFLAIPEFIMHISTSMNYFYKRMKKGKSL